MQKISEQQHLNAYNIRAGLGIRSFALLLFALLLFALSLSSIFKKESCEQIDLIPLLSISFKKSNLLKKTIFDSFPQFSPFYAKRAKRSHRSSLGRSFLKIDGIDSLSSFITKERPWGNRSHHSLQKSDQYTMTMSQLIPLIFKKERFALFTSELLFRSQKRSDSLEKPTIEFQPCFRVTTSQCRQHQSNNI